MLAMPVEVNLRAIRPSSERYRARRYRVEVEGLALSLRALTELGLSRPLLN